MGYDDFMVIRALAIAVVLLLVTAPVMAQQVQIERRPAEREPRPEIVPPGLHYEVTRPTDADFYRDSPRVQHDPAFIEPFAVDFQAGNGTGRAGLSGWTSPNTPVGPAVSGHREVPGWFAVGFSITWGGPAPTPRRAPAR